MARKLLTAVSAWAPPRPMSSLTHPGRRSPSLPSSVTPWEPQFSVSRSSHACLSAASSERKRHRDEASAPAPEGGSALTVEPGHPDGLDEHSKENGRAGREVVQQCEHIDAALEEGGACWTWGAGPAHPARQNLTHKTLLTKCKPGLWIPFADVFYLTPYSPTGVTDNQSTHSFSGTWLLCRNGKDLPSPASSLPCPPLPPLPSWSSSCNQR